MVKLSNSDFFENQTDSSRIKANIVANYFPSYCRIINKGKQSKIIYLDLFAGPGIYGDNNHSTPLLIGKEISEDINLKEIVHLMFNDNLFIDELKSNFETLFPKGTFKYKPRFGNKTVGEDEQIKKFLIKKFKDKNPHPTLLFFDPWGYKGIDTKQLSQFMENWGNEIFLFLNIKRIHAAIENDKFDDLMTLLFPATIDKIRKERRYLSSVYERLDLIMDNFAKEFKLHIPTGLYSTAFKFKEEDSTATSHYIIHFTKHSKGYELVKQIYNDFDNVGASLEKDGTYTFDAKKMNYSASLTFNFDDQNLTDLQNELMKSFKGKRITAKKLFEEHQVKTKYCSTHYAKTLRSMVDYNLVEAEFIDNKKHIVNVLLIEECILKFRE